MSINAKIKAHRIFRYLEQINSSICSSSISVLTVALLRGSPKASVLVKFELF